MPKKKSDLANYIKGALREQGSSIEKLGSKFGYSEQKMSYRINHDLLTYFEMKMIFKFLNTSDEKVLKLMKGQR